MEEFASCAAPAGALQEPRNPKGQRQPAAHCALAAQRQQTKIGTFARVETNIDFKPVGWQRFGDPLRPFDDGDRVGDRFIPAEIVEFARAAQPIEVGVDHGATRRIVDLHQGEGRARRLEIARPRQGSD